MAKKLAEYTDSILIERVNSYYTELVTKELFPSVNEASLKISQLSDKVIKRQEKGMAELANIIAQSLADKTKDYFLQEAETISSLKETTVAFSNELAHITATIQEFSEQNNNVYNKTSVVSASVSEAASLLSGTVAELSTVMGNIGLAMAQTKKDTTANNNMFKDLIETTAQVQKLASASSELLANQNEKTSQMLNDAVNAMQQNTEQAAKAMLSEFSINLNATNASIENAINTLKEITDNINIAATQFSAGISNSYGELGNKLDAKLGSVSEAMSETVNAEYEKIVSSAENYSKSFSQSVTKFNKTLEDHIDGLQIITQQLNNNISSFKNEAKDSSNIFEIGMEKSVGAALNQIDDSLAEIVKRLVSVTVNIQEAADALPKAIRSIKESK